MADVMTAPHHMPHPQHQAPSDNDFDQSEMPPPSSSLGGVAGGPNASRRPPRKSTLTQQQKNHKRQRATQDQLMTLEVEFNKNPTPTALVRERIADEINMTERSVQIWFQNRRAKIKNIAKRSIENGEDCDAIPDSMRQYLALQQYGPNKALATSMMGRPGSAYMPYGSGMLGMNGENAAGKVVIQHFACRSLSVGTWRRVGQSTMDLVIFYSPDKACVTYYIHNENAGYKIEYPFAWIKNITLEQGDALSAAEGASQRAGGLIIELTRPPRFYMDSSGQGGFYECGDFTEDQQATQILTHHLGGPSKVLSGQLAKLVSLEAYQSRHNFYDPSSFAVSAPVSPVGIPRPASQPNHLVHPHNPTVHFPPQEQAPGLMGPPGPRGHKRQRSRSVPVAVDFSMLRHPMPSFLIQHEGQSGQQQTIQHDPNIWAPVPQHHPPHPGANAYPPGSMGPNLSIDTSAPFNGFSFGAPMSATTANSPSEYGTPAFFTSAPPTDSTHPTHFNNPFNNGFLTVDQAAMIGTSNTPLSIASSHQDPVIADHSPPLNGLGRSQSTDIFGTPGDGSQFGDEGMFLSESFNKQLALPFRSPFTDDSFHSPLPDGAFTFEPPGTADSASTIYPKDPAQQSHHATPGSTNGHHNSNNTTDPAGPPSVSSLPFHSPASSHQHPVSANSQHHQDSGIAFSTPTPAPPHHHNHLSPDQHHASMSSYHASSSSPSKDAAGMLYGENKMYSSPGQMSVQHHHQHQHPQHHQHQQGLGQDARSSSGVWSSSHHHHSPLDGGSGGIGSGVVTPSGDEDLESLLATATTPGGENYGFGGNAGTGTVDPNQLGQ